MMYNIVKELDQNGKLKQYLQIGLVPIKVQFHYEIYKTYLKGIKDSKGEKFAKMKSIENASVLHRVCEKTVYLAIKTMKRE